MADLLKLDLDAMALLQPQVQALVTDIANDIKSDPVPEVGGGASPALAAAHDLVMTAGAVQLTVAQRFSQVGTLCEEARKRFLFAESQLTSAWNKLPTLLPQR